MNWRDPLNPDAGGAEVLTHEVARRFVQEGNEVTVLTSRFEGSKSEESLDGVRLVRVGSRMTVYRRARVAYREMFEGRVDVVLDEINTIPFRTPGYVNGGVHLFALVHQIARESWFYETPFPLAVLGRYWLEDAWLRGYRDTPTFAVSPSAKEALAAFGFRKIILIPQGLSATPLADLPAKEPRPTFLFVGRLKRVKMPDHALRAFALIRERLPEAQLWVVGDGYLRESLERRAPPGVTFLGKVSEAEKLRCLRRAHVLLYPAVREGWGLSVTEANAMGTPAVGYDVPGLCDSIRQGETGRRVPFGDIPALAEAALAVLGDPEGYGRMARNALEWARGFSWDQTAKVMLESFRHGG